MNSPSIINTIHTYIVLSEVVLRLGIKVISKIRIISGTSPAGGEHLGHLLHCQGKEAAILESCLLVEYNFRLLFQEKYYLKGTCLEENL